MKYWVREICDKDLYIVSKIHKDLLPNDFLPSLGHKFLSKVYYKSALQNPWGKVYVAEDDNGNVVGLINISIDSTKYFRRIVRKFWTQITLKAVWLLFSSPRRLFESVSIGNQNLIHNNNIGEIVFIAVCTTSQGKGVASLLAHKAESYLLENGINKYGVKTLKNNISAINFYHKLGFRDIKIFMCGKKKYIWLERTLD